MLTWMLYVALVSLLLGAAALAAERAARLRRGATRWFWAAAIVASLGIPTVIASVSVQLPAVFSADVSNKLIVLREETSTRLSPAPWITARAGGEQSLRNLDPLLKGAWLSVSLGMLCILALLGIHLHLRKRRWQQDALQGTRVYLSRDVGPAVVGLVRPRIVVPAWLLSAPAPQQTLVLAHEQAHLDARDPLLLTTALCLLVLMPWNLPLWWQLKRLRHAIEVDCDARVLEKGHDVRRYGETLIQVGQRQSAFVGAVAAMSESAHFLEERIKIMTFKKPNTIRRIVAFGLSALSLATLAVAAQVGPPNAPATSGKHAFDSYVGWYRLSDQAVMTVARRGSLLTVQVSGQPSVLVTEKSTDSFVAKGVDAGITFNRDAQGQVTALTLHQHGDDLVAPRVAEAEAKRVDAALDARVEAQAATPGSEQAVLRLSESLRVNSPDYQSMSPALARVTREQLPKLHAGLKELGPVRSAKFVGVEGQGWDLYELQHEHGVSQWQIALDANGTVVGALVRKK